MLAPACASRSGRRLELRRGKVGDVGCHEALLEHANNAQVLALGVPVDTSLCENVCTFMISLEGWRQI